MTNHTFIRAITPALFLYVIYFTILFAIPMGILSAFYPFIVMNICFGAKQWLAAIPQNVWELFAAGYLGYSFTKSYSSKSSKK